MRQLGGEAGLLPAGAGAQRGFRPLFLWVAGEDFFYETDNGKDSFTCMDDAEML